MRRLERILFSLGLRGDRIRARLTYRVLTSVLLERQSARR